MARNTLTAVPATRSSLPLLKIRRRLVIGALLLAAALGVLSTFAWMTSDTQTPYIPPAVDYEAVALAQTALTDYLAARNTTVAALEDVPTKYGLPATPGGAVPEPVPASQLTFAGAVPMTLGDGLRGARSSERTVQENFTFVLERRMYQATVTMSHRATGWKLAAAPSIAPLANLPGDTGLDYEDLYKGGGTSSLFPNPAGYLKRIGDWAKTYAGAGTASPELYALTGDTSNRTYTGLDGWSVLGAPQVQSVAPVTSPVPGFIVRVSLVLQPPGANSSALKADYDLYIESDKSQQQPPVVAWGPAGSYRVLNPYINADQ